MKVWVNFGSLLKVEAPWAQKSSAIPLPFPLTLRSVRLFVSPARFDDSRFLSVPRPNHNRYLQKQLISEMGSLKHAGFLRVTQHAPLRELRRFCLPNEADNYRTFHGLSKDFTSSRWKANHKRCQSRCNYWQAARDWNDIFRFTNNFLTRMAKNLRLNF